jgi:leucyl-tRNA synthetase
VDLYIGGVEHAVLHLLYARFWHKVLFDLGHVSTPEPFQRLFNQGYIQAAAFKDARGLYVEASQVIEGTDAGGKPVFTFQGQPVTREFGKMGKSLKNAVTPDDIARDFGTDTLRVYEMSMGPLEASKPWNTRDISGAYRFLQRVWRVLIDEDTSASRVHPDPGFTGEPAVRKALHKAIKQVRRDMERLAFNTAVSKLIEFNNALSALEPVPGSTPGTPIPRECARGLILMLAPLAPHIAEELWHRVILGRGPMDARSGSIAHEPFPEFDASLAADDEIEIAVQVLGKVKHRMMVPAGASEEQVKAIVLADPAVVALLEGKAIKKAIVVPSRLVNFVV